MKVIIVITFTFYFLFGFSQYRTDVGILIGGANYLGEIGGNEQSRRDFVMDMKLQQTRKSFGIFFRRRINNTYGVTASLNYIEIGGNDNLTSNSARKGRNLSFKNDIVELASRGEYYFYSVYDVGGHSRYILDFKPYFFAGLGLFYSNPKAELNGKYYALRPLKTEGQESPYSLINISIPMGMGLYFTYNKKYRISCEIGWRKTFTDYLDDVSTIYASEELLGSDLAIELANRNDELLDFATVSSNNYSSGNKRGNARNNDSYLMAQIGMSYVMRGTYYHKIPIRGSHIQKVRFVRAKF